jgi:hypothetical protein
VRIVLPFVLLCLAGCVGGPRQINVGAQVPWHVGTPSDIRAYVVSQGHTPVMYPLYYGGLTDHDAMLLWTARSFDDAKNKQAQEIGWQINEFCHLVDLMGGDHWKAAYMISGGDLHATCPDAPVQAQAMFKALDEARKAASR